MAFIIQGNYHFMPAFLTKLSPKRFGEGSTFTAVVRYDMVNLIWITAMRQAAGAIWNKFRLG